MRIDDSARRLWGGMEVRRGGGGGSPVYSSMLLLTLTDTVSSRGLPHPTDGEAVSYMLISRDLLVCLLSSLSSSCTPRHHGKMNCRASERQRGRVREGA